MNINLTGGEDVQGPLRGSPGTPIVFGIGIGTTVMAKLTVFRIITDADGIHYELKADDHRTVIVDAKDISRVRSAGIEG